MVTTQPVFLSKQERAELALKKRQEEVAARKRQMDQEREARQKYFEEASFSSGHQDSRRRWDGREEEREKQREETLLLKDKEKEMEAIKVDLVLNSTILSCLVV